MSIKPKMNIKTIQSLNQLNTDFYQTTAIDFNESRNYYWQGFTEILRFLKPIGSMSVLDVGCGNGRLGQFLQENLHDTLLEYTGIDSNPKLLEFAQEKLSDVSPRLEQRDIVTSLINGDDFATNQRYDLVVCLGVFHHIPTFGLRLALLKKLLSKLNQNGILIISFWQFLSIPRLEKKIVKTDYPLEENDFILDWKRGKNALRYCHFCDETEQNLLVSQASAELTERFTADAKESTGNTYLVLKQ